MEHTVIQGEVYWLAHSRRYKLAATGATMEEAIVNIRKIEQTMARLTAKRLMAGLSADA